ncbi:MAG: cyclic nucleotide-binding domain-containing protein [Rhodospirillales bacterium]|nr:cyclic nucleotide-binding domain-containing protein [Rhodospirillales bacterium]
MTNTTTVRSLTAADVRAIGEAPLFSEIDRATVEMLLSDAQVVAYDAPTLLFSQGDGADRFFVVLDGQVRLLALTEDGAQSVVEVFEPVTTFAEAAMFASRRFPLSAEVVEGSRLVHVPAASFLKNLARDKTAAFKMLAALSRWQNRLLREISNLKVRTPGQRLAAFLLTQTVVESGPAEFRLPFRKTLIASRIGITPESLSRAMSRLKAEGVTGTGSVIRIADVARLKAFCLTTGDGGGETA